MNKVICIRPDEFQKVELGFGYKSVVLVLVLVFFWYNTLPAKDPP